MSEETVTSEAGGGKLGITPALGASWRSGVRTLCLAPVELKSVGFKMRKIEERPQQSRG